MRPHVTLSGGSTASNPWCTRSPIRRTAAIVWLVGALAAAPAAADEMQLAWGGCEGQGGASNLVLTCDTPLPPPSLYLSFEITDPIQDLVAIDFAFVVRVDGLDLPPFWEFTTSIGTYCNGGLYAYAGPSAACPGAPSALPASATAIVGFVSPYETPQFGKFVGSVFVPAQDAVNLAPGQYFAAVLVLDLTWAAESGGACTGCSAALRFGDEDYIGSKIYSSPKISLGTLNGSRFIANPICINANGGGTLACGPTPTVPSTWGRLKSLYR